MMTESFLQKQIEVKKLFEGCTTPESRYQLIIDLGKKQPRLDPAFKKEENLVSGCQSRMFLHSEFNEGCVFFQTESDALISQGLAVLLVLVYSGEAPEVILKCPPTYIEELGIPQTLTPSRANGLASIYLRMKQDALSYYMQVRPL